jgi:hypothetical protein
MNLQEAGLQVFADLNNPCSFKKSALLLTCLFGFIGQIFPEKFFVHQSFPTLHDSS